MAGLCRAQRWWSRDALQRTTEIRRGLVARTGIGGYPHGYCSPPSGFGRTGGESFYGWLAAGHGRGENATLVRVEVHRGLPSSARDPVGYGANRRQAAAWIKEGGSIVVPRLRPLRYPSSRAADQTPVEKGIDVQLALAVAETILTDTADVAILFTHDTDLLPAVEMVARLNGARRIETASRSSRSFAQRLREVPGVHHHRISGKVFERRSVAERAYRSLQVAAVNDARHAPALAVADRSPQDAQLADPQSPPGRSSLQCAIVRIGRQRLVGEHVGHRTQGCAVVVGVELA